MTYEVALATIFSAILAGISWNTLGIWQKWRVGKLDDGIDWAKVKKNVIIGAILGVIAYGYDLSQGGTVVGAIGSVEAFFLAVIAFFPLVVVADKIFTQKQTEDEED